MKKSIIALIVILFLVSTAMAFVGVVHANETRAITLPWSVIGSGGMGGSAGGYTIHSTLGQPVAGSGVSEDYSFTSGFWTEVIESIVEFFNYLPLIVR